MRRLALLSVLVFAACTDEGADAERRYEIVKKTGDSQDICAAGRKVADTYLELKNEQKYRWWEATSGIDCNRVLLEALEGTSTSKGSAMAEKLEAEALQIAEEADKAAAPANACDPELEDC